MGWETVLICDEHWYEEEGDRIPVRLRTEALDEGERCYRCGEEANIAVRRQVGERPNPGSDEAIAQGCTCAALDNNHGRFAPWPPDGWWITQGCPIHTGGTEEQVIGRAG